jgi:hypothetical protein
LLVGVELDWSGSKQLRAQRTTINEFGGRAARDASFPVPGERATVDHFA